MTTLNLRIYRSQEFKNWYKVLSLKEKRVVDSRIDTFKEYGHLLQAKILSSDLSLYEFKWNSGLRVYFSILEDWDGHFLLLLTGGNKNSQPANITSAKRIIINALHVIKKKQGKT
jgi:putative addiction module killer protein